MAVPLDRGHYGGQSNGTTKKNYFSLCVREIWCLWWFAPGGYFADREVILSALSLNCNDHSQIPCFVFDTSIHQLLKAISVKDLF